MPTLDQYKTTAALLAMARKDPDAVSGFLNGDRIETTQEAVFVVKGNTKVRRVMALLMANDLMSSNPVNPPAQVLADQELADAVRSQRDYQDIKALAGDDRSGWKSAAIAWMVCSSLHSEYAAGKDPLFTTRHADFERRAEEARAHALGVEGKKNG